MKSNLIVRSGLVLTLVAGAVVPSLLAADTKPKRLASQAFMRQKLAWSQAALEGLALEKFDLVSKNSIRMRDMTQSNQWFTVKQPDYLAQTTNFQKSVDALYMAAVDKNLEAATEAYTKVARNCVECHRLVRVDQHKKGSAAQPATSKSELSLKPVILP